MYNEVGAPQDKAEKDEENDDRQSTSAQHDPLYQVETPVQSHLQQIKRAMPE
jgi:hypothetical protein